MKLLNTRSLGAEVLEYDRRQESREEIAARTACERGAVLVPSFDDFDIIAGQGSAGIELVEQAREAGIKIDDVLVPCSGGGLAAGIALAIQTLSPGTRIWSVEPVGFNDHERSLAAGHRLRNEHPATSICDALLAPQPGEITFEINRRLLAGGLSVSDDEVRAAIVYAARELKLVLEPGGAVALAAVLARRLPLEGRSVVIVLSGANIDEAMLAQILST
jgi:threonine dehydratase